jgi:hypothetical protein
VYPTPLPLAAYRGAIALDEPFGPGTGHDPGGRPADLVREALGLSVSAGADRLINALTVPHPAPNPTVAP